MNYDILKIAFIFIFGLITTEIYNIYLPRNKKLLIKEKILYSFLYGVIVYLIYDFLNYLISSISFLLFCPLHSKEYITEIKPTITFLFNTLEQKENLKLGGVNIAFLVFISISFGGILSYIRTKKFFSLIGNKLLLKDSSVGGDSLLESIYETNHKLYKPLLNMWVQIKLLDGSAHYFGDLQMYEVFDDRIELLLFDVDIYFEKNTSDKNYSQHAVYLNLKPGTFQIEYNNG